MSADEGDSGGGKDIKKRVYAIKRIHETIDTYEVDGSDNEDELLTRIASEGRPMKWLRVVLGISLAGNLVLSTEFIKTNYGLPYGEAIQVVEAIAALILLVGGVVWSRRD